jgi:peptidoglycan-associated lipoprotein
LEPVFFDYDMSEVRDDARPVLQEAARMLRERSSATIQVEGHCDERGTNEYNLSLGEERATAVRDYLIGLGIAGDRIQTVSRGEESPFCSESTESCWQQNRRGQFNVTSE